jgi:hypothetical protein
MPGPYRIQKKHRTADDTFCVRVGQAKYLIKQHDTSIRAVACAARLAALNCFVKMASGCSRVMMSVNAGM